VGHPYFPLGKVGLVPGDDPYIGRLRWFPAQHVVAVNDSS